jgi:hypothetical protein
MIHKAELIKMYIENDACRMELSPRPSTTNDLGIIATPRLPYKDVFITFIDPEGAYILVRRNNSKMHWGDCELPSTFEYILALALREAEKEKDEKVTVNAKSSLFKREGKS